MSAFSVMIDPEACAVNIRSLDKTATMLRWLSQAEIYIARNSDHMVIA